MTRSGRMTGLAAAVALAVGAGTAAGDGRIPDHLKQGPKPVASGETVMVSTQLRSVTEAALEVLRDGGNAVDAAITAAFLQGVQDYHQNHLFGSMTGLYYEAETGNYYAFNGYIERPKAGRCGDGDPTRVAIGGKMRGLKELAERFGSRPWESYVAPAIAAAEEGVEMTSFMYGVIFNTWTTSEYIRGNPDAREFYMPDGHLVSVGDRWKMPALAETLRKVQSDPDYMITGGFVERFIDKAQARGGCVTMEDFEDYEILWSEPLRFTYRGREIITEPPPVAGGQMLGYNLNVLQHFPLREQGHYSESIETLETMARTLARTDIEVRWAMADPRQFNVPTELWLSPEYGRMSAEFVRQTMPRTDLPSGDDDTAAASRDGSADDARPVVASVRDFLHFDDSNHNVIVDADGNWITYLHTGHGGMPDMFLDGVAATGSRRWVQTRGEGRRASTHVTATFIAEDGVPVLALGSPGTPAQPITQALVSIIDFDMSPDQAVDAPKFWAYQHLGPDDSTQTSRDFLNLVTLQMESRVSDEVRRGIAARGMQMFDRGDYMWNIGSIQIVWRDPDTGRLYGTSDPRRLGWADGY